MKIPPKLIHSKPKIPDTLPSGYYFKVRPSKDRYNRDEICVTLYRERSGWFSKKIATDVISGHVVYNLQTAVSYVEASMRILVKKLLVDLEYQKYVYGRHP